MLALTRSGATFYELGMVFSLGLLVTVVHMLSSTFLSNLIFYYSAATMISVFIDKFSPGFRQPPGIQLVRIITNLVYFLLSIYIFTYAIYFISSATQRMALSMTSMVRSQMMEIYNHGKTSFGIIFFLIHNIVISLIRAFMNLFLLIFLYVAEVNEWDLNRYSW